MFPFDNPRFHRTIPVSVLILGLAACGLMPVAAAGEESRTSPPAFNLPELVISGPSQLATQDLAKDREPAPTSLGAKPIPADAAKALQSPPMGADQKEEPVAPRTGCLFASVGGGTSRDQAYPL